MAAPTGKRALEQVDDDVAKKTKLLNNVSKLDTFLSWCKDGHLELSEKVSMICVTSQVIQGVSTKSHIIARITQVPNMFYFIVLFTSK
jgi:hypothetical protein